MQRHQVKESLSTYLHLERSHWGISALAVAPMSRIASQGYRPPPSRYCPTRRFPAKRGRRNMNLLILSGSIGDQRPWIPCLERSGMQVFRRTRRDGRMRDSAGPNPRTTSRSALIRAFFEKLIEKTLRGRPGMAIHRLFHAVAAWLGIPALLGSALLGTALVALSAPPDGIWTNLGPNGGEIYSVAVDPSSPSTLWAGTIN